MVTDVAADDVLNIRTEPNGSSDIVGELGPYTLNVEVLRENDGWGYVGAGEQSGWVSMRFLKENPAPPDQIPRPFSCFGAEPFWDMTFYPRGAEYNELGFERRDLTVIGEHIADKGYLIVAREGPTLIHTLNVNGLSCTDGMSDRNFGMSAILFTQAPEGNFVQNGCCTMQIN